MHRPVPPLPARLAGLALLLVTLAGSPAPVVAGELRFRQVAEPWGLVFRHHHGGSGELYMPETMGSGVVLFDFDGDGDADVFFVDSGELPGYEGPPGRSRLFRNDGAGRFTDWTDRAGIEVTGYGMGATAGDVDGDGDPDLYVTAFGRDQLFENRGDGTFRDATAAAGLGNPDWGVSAGFADSDGDGDLDLYVTNYVDFELETNKICGLEARGVRSYCHPDVYGGQADRFYLNRGDGTFRDATTEAGFAGADGKGLGVVWGDVDDDGDQDLYVANDMTPNYLFLNRGDGSFEDAGLVSGTALSERGEPEAGMGVDLADLDADGRGDLIVTHLDLQTNAVYRNLGNRIFTDARHVSRLAEGSIAKVGFGVVVADFDLDGTADVAVANGHIIHNIELFGTGGSYRQANQVFRGGPPGRFREETGAGLAAVVRSSRGMAAGDLDGDGDLDLVISNSNDLAEVWENVSSAMGRFLAVEVVSSPTGATAVGTRVELVAAGPRQVRELRTASSYASQNEAVLRFGLGAHGTTTGAAEPPGLVIRFPDGSRREIRGLMADRRLRLERP